MDIKVDHEIGSSVWLILKTKKITNPCPLCSGKGYAISPHLRSKVSCFRCKGTGGESTTETFVCGPLEVNSIMVLVTRDDMHLNFHTRYKVTTNDVEIGKKMKDAEVYQTYFKTEEEANLKCAELIADNTPFR